MTKHTPTPWIEAGSHDFRGADMALVGMVNPTVRQGRIDRAFILEAVNNHDALVAALEWYAKDYDDDKKCSQWDGGAKAREALYALLPKQQTTVEP